jgi:hypothetical protein
VASLLGSCLKIGLNIGQWLQDRVPFGFKPRWCDRTVTFFLHLESYLGHVTQREFFSKEGSDQFLSKDCTVTLEGFLKQASYFPKWQEKDKSINSKRE